MYLFIYVVIFLFLFYYYYFFFFFLGGGGGVPIDDPCISCALIASSLDSSTISLYLFPVISGLH